MLVFNVQATLETPMITRTHLKGDAESEAVYSPCESYRYLLTRVWDAQGPKALFVMLNPSTATEAQNDPTVERCERRSRALGFGAFRVTNIFAFRATDPRVMRAQADPVGPENDAAIRDSALRWADRIICAWCAFAAWSAGGGNAAHLGQAAVHAWTHTGRSPKASAVHRIRSPTRALGLIVTARAVPPSLPASPLPR